MFAPLRFLYAARPHASPGILAASVAVAAIFAATPFAIPEVADRLGVGVGAAGIISTAQVGAFAVVTFLLPRFLSGSRRVLVTAAAAAVVGNLLSAAATTFALLAASRIITGGAAGVLTWLAWTDAMNDRRVMRDVAVVGPIVAMVASPILGWIAGQGSDVHLWLVLAGVGLPAMVLPIDVAEARPRVVARSASRSNRVLLAALFTLTMAGSGLFVFLATLAQRLVGLSALAASLGFSLNALGGIVGSRLTTRSGWGGVWLSACAVSAAVIITVHHPVAYYTGMAGWGFAFWMGVPEAMRLLASRSLSPAERAGDAQSLMAAGRALGPLAGGVLVTAGDFTALGLAASGGLLAAAITVSAVERYRRDAPPLPAGRAAEPETGSTRANGRLSRRRGTS